MYSVKNDPHIKRRKPRNGRIHHDQPQQEKPQPHRTEDDRHSRKGLEHRKCPGTVQKSVARRTGHP